MAKDDIGKDMATAQAPEARGGALGASVGAGAEDDIPAVDRPAKTGAHTTDASGGGGGGGHEAAKAHGQAATVDTSLPATRQELLALHAEARRRRAGAPRGSAAYRDAADEIGRIEIRIAAIERDQVPPLV